MVPNNGPILFVKFLRVNICSFSLNYLLELNAAVVLFGLGTTLSMCVLFRDCEPMPFHLSMPNVQLNYNKNPNFGLIILGKSFYRVPILTAHLLFMRVLILSTIMPELFANDASTSV